MFIYSRVWLCEMIKRGHVRKHSDKSPVTCKRKPSYCRQLNATLLASKRQRRSFFNSQFLPEGWLRSAEIRTSCLITEQQGVHVAGPVLPRWASARSVGFLAKKRCAAQRRAGSKTLSSPVGISCFSGASGCRNCRQGFFCFQWHLGYVFARTATPQPVHSCHSFC